MAKNPTLPPLNLKEKGNQLQAHVKTLPGKIAGVSKKVPIPLLIATGLAFMGSGYVTFKLGDVALKGVSSPEINPAQKLIDRPTQQAGESQPLVAFKPLSIAKVEKEVSIYINSQQKTTKPSKSAVKGKGKNSAKTLAKESKTNSAKKSVN
ncbi:MAG: hypothetical protein ACKN9E_07740 [Microcystaceae cyanobacterium]